MPYVLRTVALASSERATGVFEDTVATLAISNVKDKAHRTCECVSAIVETELHNSFAFVIYRVFRLSKQLFYRADDFIWRHISYGAKGNITNILQSTLWKQDITSKDLFADSGNLWVVQPLVPHEDTKAVCRITLKVRSGCSKDKKPG